MRDSYLHRAVMSKTLLAVRFPISLTFAQPLHTPAASMRTDRFSSPSFINKDMS